MRYTYENIGLFREPEEFNKDTQKELLQYAVGGLLYMPASNMKIADKIIAGQVSNIKSMVLDLEDALGDDMIGFGKNNICTIATKLEQAISEGRMRYEDVPLIFVRVREKGQMKQLVESLGSRCKYITGFNIPKFDRYTCNEYINEFMEISDKVYLEFGCKLYIMPIIENKWAMYRQHRMDNLLRINDALRPLHENVLNIRVGGADFCNIFGIRRDITEIIEDIGVVRSVFADIINVFAKNYVVSGPVWEYYGKAGEDGDNQWKEGLIRELRADRLNGFIGKTCIHPTQLPVVQESLIVNRRDYEDALSILGMNPNTSGVQRGSNDTHNNYRMNEVKTHTNWAHKVISLAHIYGVKHYK